MSLLRKIFRLNLSGLRNAVLLDRSIHHDILAGRGNTDDYPSDFSEEEKKNIKSVRAMTMTSPERLITLSNAVEYVVKHGIEGNIVECGVWKGGSMMLVAKTLLRLQDTGRELYLFDTFEGMSAPGEKDISAVDDRKAEDLLAEADKLEGDNIWCYSSVDEVKANLAGTGYPPEKMFFIKGKVEDSLPYPAIGKIALLRLDTDWYESTRHELETLYDSLVPGGILIVDDYGHWRGSKKAVDEFIESRKLRIFLHRIDYTGRLAIKA